MFAAVAERAQTTISRRRGIYFLILGRNSPSCAPTGLRGLRDKIIAIAGLLEEISNVPMVAKELALIRSLQTEDFWPGIACSDP